MVISEDTIRTACYTDLRDDQCPKLYRLRGHSASCPEKSGEPVSIDGLGEGAPRSPLAARAKRPAYSLWPGRFAIQYPRSSGVDCRNVGRPAGVIH